MSRTVSLLLKLASPLRWRRYVTSRLRSRQINRADDALDSRLREIGPLPPGTGDYVFADGMWRNPNHFFRLRLFIEAIRSRGHSPALLGFLRRRTDWREKRALERIGFAAFVYIDEDPEYRTEQFLDEARRLLATARTHADILNIVLPDGIPAYTFYDTVLKLTSDPQPPLDLPVWTTSLAEMLRNQAIYNREFSARKVMHVAVSHPWKNEWATLTWTALKAGVPVSHITGFCEALRIRRFRQRDDYARPVEHLPYAAFEALSPDVRRKLVQIGTDDLAKRESGNSSDLNVRCAFEPGRRIENREQARAALSGQTTKPVIVVYSHVWYDFPHTFAMRNFTDFRDWIELTLREIRSIDDVVWLLKPHPTEQWYGGFKLTDVARELPSHVRLLPTQTDSKTVTTAADAITTVHGTVAMEAAAAGVAVILADRSYFSDWKIAHAATDRADYVRLLKAAGKLSAPDAAARDRAKACFALALAEPPMEVGALQISCDSGGIELYDEVASRYGSQQGLRQREIERIAAFLEQSEIDSFAAYHLVENARRTTADLQAVS